ncbi:MAG: hypothetical protein V8Q84_07815 [Bilophila sp.]
MEATPDLLQEPSLYPTLALLKPVSDDLRITSPFGVRVHPLKRRRLMHAGVDIAGKRGKKSWRPPRAPSSTAGVRVPTASP